MNADTRHRPPRSGTTLVRLLVWGVTDADQEHAIRRAEQGWSRNLWEFVESERRSGDLCPLNLKDPKALAADQGYGWAYVVFRAGGAR